MFPSVSELNTLRTCMMETKMEVRFFEAEVEHTPRLRMINKTKNDAAAVLIQ